VLRSAKLCTINHKQPQSIFHDQGDQQNHQPKQINQAAIMSKRFTTGVFHDEELLLKAVRNIRSRGIKIHDVYTPFAVHGMEDALGLEDSRLHTAGFLFGATGTITAVTLMTWASFNYPNVFGGKPIFALPAFIPITFELTVLFAAVGMTLTFLIKSNLLPGVKPRIMDTRITDDKFVIAFDQADFNPEQLQQLITLLRENGAEEVNHKEFAE
jgi:hypothetical protein